MLVRPSAPPTDNAGIEGDGVKITVVGGGSTYTPELVSGLSRERDRIDVRELVLHDIDAERREVVGGLAARMLERQGYEGTLELTDDLDRAVDGALRASFFNCGQVCSGVERIYVEGALFEPFVEELARRASALELGPLISQEQREKVEALVGDALASGARALTGGRARDGRGWFYEPKVLVDVPASARIERDEIFGPVVTVDRVADETAAVARANASAYGLGASVWTKDRARAAAIARRVHAGTVWHNDHAYSYAAAQATWGGRGESGFGRTHSRHGLHDLTSIKFVDSDSGRVPVPWWFPYDKQSAETFRGVVRVLYGDNKLRAAWRERRALFHAARRYLR